MATADRQADVLLRVLLVEDCDDDARLALNELAAEGFRGHSRRVQTADELRSAVRAEPWDLVLADHVLPGFSSSHARRVLAEAESDTPGLDGSGGLAGATVADA